MYHHKLLLVLVLLLSWVPYIIFGLLAFLGYIPTWIVHWFDIDFFGTIISVDINLFYIPYLVSTGIGLVGGFMVWCFVEPCEPSIPFIQQDESDTPIL